MLIRDNNNECIYTKLITYFIHLQFLSLKTDCFEILPFALFFTTKANGLRR